MGLEKTLSRLQYILYLFFALLGLPSSCQIIGEKRTVKATNTSAIIYQPPLTDPVWNVNENKSKISTAEITASAMFQFRGELTS